MLESYMINTSETLSELTKSPEWLECNVSDGTSIESSEVGARGVINFI